MESRTIANVSSLSLDRESRHGILICHATLQTFNSEPRPQFTFKREQLEETDEKLKVFQTTTIQLRQHPLHHRLHKEVGFSRHLTPTSRHIERLQLRNTITIITTLPLFTLLLVPLSLATSQHRTEELLWILEEEEEV